MCVLLHSYVSHVSYVCHIPPQAAMCVLLHWGRGWLATFPHPPIPALAAIERTLGKHDARLASHLARCGVAAHEWAWPILRSAFSEVVLSSLVMMMWRIRISSLNHHSP